MENYQRISQLLVRIQLLMIDNKEITFVVQGPQFFRKGINLTLTALQSIKKFYPGAQIIFSTTDSDVDQRIRDLDHCLTLIINDVGSLQLPGLNPQNSNRQIYGTFKGLEYCHTKWVCKTRSDVFFEKWFDFQEALKKFPLCPDIDKLNSSGTKVAVSNVTSKRFQIEENYIHHVSDWFYFGKISAVREIFSVPLVDKISNNNAVRYKSCEQYIWESWAITNSGGDKSLEAAETFLITNAIVLDANQIGFKSFKRGYSIPFGVNGYYGMHHIDWLRLYYNHNHLDTTISLRIAILSWLFRSFHFVKHRAVIVPLISLKRLVKRSV